MVDSSFSYPGHGSRCDRREVAQPRCTACTGGGLKPLASLFLSAGLAALVAIAISIVPASSIADSLIDNQVRQLMIQDSIGSNPGQLRGPRTPGSFLL